LSRWEQEGIYAGIEMDKELEKGVFSLLVTPVNEYCDTSTQKIS
jgi:hypothetical protein